jgi:hypothetical protein
VGKTFSVEAAFVDAKQPSDMVTNAVIDNPLILNAPDDAIALFNKAL